MKMYDLTLGSVQEVLNCRTLIAVGMCKGGQEKRFYGNLWTQEYVIEKNGKYKSGGQALEELIIEYNEM